MTAFFIAGTDTGVGKTVITGHLAKSLQSSGVSVVTQKWIQSGIEPDGSTDLNVHDQHYAPPDCDLSDRCPYIFPDPASPHLSAALSQCTIHKNTLFEASDRLQGAGHTVLIEGSGGLLVPYTSSELMIDLLADYPMPTILVSANRLGTLNHTYLSIEALQHRNIPIAGLILNDGAPGCKETTQAIRDDNAHNLSQNLNIPIERITNTPVSLTQFIQKIT